METNVIAASDAQTKFFELLRRAKAGESFLITLDGSEAARLAPLREFPDKAGLAALVSRIDEVRKGTRLNAAGLEKLTIRQLIEEGRR
jgi:prevent-host-death family protein